MSCITEHDVLYVEFNQCSQNTKSVLRNIPIYKNANQKSMRQKLMLFHNVVCGMSDHNIESTWIPLKTCR